MTSKDSWPRPGRARNRRETGATRARAPRDRRGWNLLVGPRTMSDCSFEQSPIFKLVIQNRFEEIEVRNRFGVFQSSTNYNKRRKLVSGKATSFRRRWKEKVNYDYRRGLGAGFALVAAGVAVGVAAGFVGAAVPLPVPFPVEVPVVGAAPEVPVVVVVAGAAGNEVSGVGSGGNGFARMPRPARSFQLSPLL